MSVCFFFKSNPSQINVRKKSLIKTMSSEIIGKDTEQAERWFILIMKTDTPTLNAIVP